MIQIPTKQQTITWNEKTDKCSLEEFLKGLENIPEFRQIDAVVPTEYHAKQWQKVDEPKAQVISKALVIFTVRLKEF
jgi:hypothetical protein